MAKYRKKPVVIEAIRWNPFEMTISDVERFVGAYADEGGLLYKGKYKGDLIIKTLEGDMTVIEGDWIIKGVKGEFYPCKNDIFEMTYELEPEEITQEQWDYVVDVAKFMLDEYKKIPTGAFGAMNIELMVNRYENGERSHELYDEMNGLDQ